MNIKPDTKGVFRTLAMMELFVKIVDNFQPLINFAKISTIDAQLGSKYGSAFFKNLMKVLVTL